MKFGIFVFGDNHPELGRSNQRYYEEVLTMAEWAEELGFDSFWLGEHHFYWYGTCVSPPMLIAALGQRTKKIRLGPAVSVLPFHHPLIVAEEYALADNLCGGKTEFRHRQRLFAGRIQDVRDVDGGSERKILGGIRRHIEGVDSGAVFAQGKIFPDRERLPVYEAPAKTDAADLGSRFQRRDLDQAGELGFPTMGIPFVRSTRYSRSSKRTTSSRNLTFGRAIRKSRISWLPCMFTFTAAGKRRSGSAVLTLSALSNILEPLGAPARRFPISTTSEKKDSSFSPRPRTRSNLSEYQAIGVTHVICMVNFGGAPMSEVRRTMELMSKEVFRSFSEKNCELNAPCAISAAGFN